MTPFRTDNLVWGSFITKEGGNEMRFPKLKLRSRGQFEPGFGVGGLISLLILIAIGALVLYEVTGALDVETNSYADNAIKNVEEKGSTVFSLLTILAIVVVAALIIGVVMRAIGGMGGAVGPAGPGAL